MSITSEAYKTLLSKKSSKDAILRQQVTPKSAFFTIWGNIPSKKNSRLLFWRNGRQYNIPSPAYTKWENTAVFYIRHIKPVDKVNSVTLTFYAESKRRKDLTNCAEGVMDLLVKAGILQDDNWFVVPKIVLVFGGVDRQEPKVEIQITTSMETTHKQTTPSMPQPQTSP